MWMNSVCWIEWPIDSRHYWSLHLGGKPNNDDVEIALKSIELGDFSCFLKVLKLSKFWRIKKLESWDLRLEKALKLTESFQAFQAKCFNLNTFYKKHKSTNLLHLLIIKLTRKSGLFSESCLKGSAVNLRFNIKVQISLWPIIM